MIPDLAATLKELQEEANALDPRIEAAVALRDAAQEDLSELVERQRELNRQILAALKARREA